MVTKRTMLLHAIENDKEFVVRHKDWFKKKPWFNYDLYLIFHKECVLVIFNNFFFKSDVFLFVADSDQILLVRKIEQLIVIKSL